MTYSIYRKLVQSSVECNISVKQLVIRVYTKGRILRRVLVHIFQCLFYRTSIRNTLINCKYWLAIFQSLLGNELIRNDNSIKWQSCVTPGETVLLLVLVSLFLYILFFYRKCDWDQKWDSLTFMAPEPDGGKTKRFSLSVVFGKSADVRTWRLP